MEAQPRYVSHHRLSHQRLRKMAGRRSLRRRSRPAARQLALAAIVVLGVAARAAAGPAATRQLQLNDVDVHAAPNATVAATNDCRLGNTTIPCRPACESAAAGCSEFSVISAGTCDSTPGCTAVATERDCASVPTRADITLLEGHGHMTVGASQRASTPSGCLLHPQARGGSAYRLKYNANDDSTRACSSRWKCVCKGLCAPVAAVDTQATSTRRAGGKHESYTATSGQQDTAAEAQRLPQQQSGQAAAESPGGKTAVLGGLCLLSCVCVCSYCSTRCRRHQGISKYELVQTDPDGTDA
jgi:hypothetical protein